jgi:hypothetical protein
MKQPARSTRAETVPAPDSPFDVVYDLIVFGAGYAGFAATQTAAKAGKQVLLVDARCDLLWESSRTFHADTGLWSDRFAEFGRTMARITGIAGERVDGGIAEWVANELLRDAKTPRLYYAAPVAVEMDAGALAAVTVACAEGLRRLVARQWIDATENGCVARLCRRSPAPRAPASLTAYAMLQCLHWPQPQDLKLSMAECPSGSLAWQPSHWTAERALKITVPGSCKLPLSAGLLAALRTLRTALGSAGDDAFVSHASYAFYPTYGEGRTVASPADNLALAVPGFARKAVVTLGDRYELGCAALAHLAECPGCTTGRKLMRRPPAPPISTGRLAADIVVAGLGTAGAVAAIAAGRSSRRILAFETQSFPGGVAVGAGIHAYYYGCPGGLQQEIDQRVGAIMPLFARRDNWPNGFHPHAKRCVLDTLLADARVTACYDSQLLSVKRVGARITEALVATPDGIRTVQAKAWIDATGEATLCSTAGVPSHLGRCSDGNLHAYTQSCTAFSYDQTQLTAFISNPDSGFVDPNDSPDMTRARIEGLHGYALQVCNAFNRAAGMVPAVGLRQGRRVETDYLVTLDDLLEGRRFDDVIGYTGSHYDNHANDYFAESDTAAFLVWAAGSWGARTACEIPYRVLLPQGIGNLWVACRAAGGNAEACMCLRMQRDLQRLGEAAGIAAALALKHKTSNRDVPYGPLRDALMASGALTPPRPDRLSFGRAVTDLSGDPVLNGPATDANIQAWLDSLSQPTPSLALWRLYRLGPAKVASRVKPLVKSPDANRAFHAAVICCAWGDAAGEAVLIDAVKRAEPPQGKLFPRSGVAAWALGCGGTSRAWSVLAAYAQAPANPVLARLTAASSCARIAQRHAPRPSDCARIARLIPALADCQQKLRPWQSDFVAEQLRIAFHLPRDPALIAPYLQSPSLVVRRAFTNFL